MITDVFNLEIFNNILNTDKKQIENIAWISFPLSVKDGEPKVNWPLISNLS